MALVNTFHPKDPPNFQIIWNSFTQELEKPQRQPTIRVVCSVAKTKSRGSITLKSAHYQDPPKIDPAHLEHQDDVRVMKKGVKLLFEYMKTPTMSKYSPELDAESFPKCKDYLNSDLDRLVDCMVARYTTTAYHPVSTARMGRGGDRRAVVGPDLRVKRLGRLRVVDASVMPEVPAANTNAPTMMVAERGADLVKASHT